MKARRPGIGLGRLCWLFGVTRQAYYQSLYREEEMGMEQELVVKEVLEIRKRHPRLGARKLYVMLETFMLGHGIKMGRDGLFDLLSAHRLLVRRRTRKVSTTQSHHWLRKYPNLIRGLVPTAPNELFVSDITYWKIGTGHVYISLVTDAYSHKVVGHKLSETLEAAASVAALEMALGGVKKGAGLIHHSDWGVQYCSFGYVGLLQGHGAQISMTENGDPLENAVAERINGILKGEYLECYTVDGFGQAEKLLDAVIKLYNGERPHMSIGNLTPEKVHALEITKGEKKWKNYYQKKEYVNPDQD